MAEKKLYSMIFGKLNKLNDYSSKYHGCRAYNCNLLLDFAAYSRYFRETYLPIDRLRNLTANKAAPICFKP